jgi:hypothetical protein
MNDIEDAGLSLAIELEGQLQAAWLAAAKWPIGL